MMNAEQLSRVGEKLVKRCGSRDPFEIARQLGINVMLCENFGSLKGMYRVIKRNRFIFLNNSLDENMLRIVCAHELGHDQLHRNMAKTTPIHEFMLYDMKSKPEYEANIVAAEILMDSDEVLRYIYEYGYTAEQIASAMSTDINLVALKVAHLATLGYNLHALEHKSNFLKSRTFEESGLAPLFCCTNCAGGACTIINLTSAFHTISILSSCCSALCFLRAFSYYLFCHLTSPLDRSG